MKDQLQAAVQNGQLTQAQANALEQRLKQKGRPCPLVPFRFFGFGPRGRVHAHGRAAGRTAAAAARVLAQISRLATRPFGMFAGPGRSMQPPATSA